MISLVFKSLSHLLGLKKKLFLEAILFYPTFECISKAFSIFYYFLTTRSECAIHMVNFCMAHALFLHKTVVILSTKLTGGLLVACTLCLLPLWDAVMQNHHFPPAARGDAKQSWGPAGLASLATQAPGSHTCTLCPRSCVLHRSGFVGRFHFCNWFVIHLSKL